MSFLLRIFRRPDYDSDITELIGTLREQRPGLEARQRQSRAIWWDKAVDREALAEWGQARVPQKPYVYQTEGK
jgi:hypothetical protein